MSPFYFILIWSGFIPDAWHRLTSVKSASFFTSELNSPKSVPFYRPESLGPQHEDMEFYLSGKNIFGLKGPIIEMEYKQKVLEIASERDNDLLEYAIYL